MFESAIEYAKRGWSIIPIGTKKKPALNSWTKFQRERPTESELKLLFATNGIRGLAVICGQVSGHLVCRDFDVAGSYHAWAKEQPEMAATLPTVKTARGYHVYFRSRECTKILKLGNGELRGAGYCLLPPSKHPSGLVYVWIVPLPDGEIPGINPIEFGLLPEVTESTERTEKLLLSSQLSSVLSVSQSTTTAIRDAILVTLPNHESQRNKCIFEFARALKAICALADKPVVMLREFVRGWHQAALPVIGTKPFEDTWADFIYGWNKVRFPRGSDPMSLILARADSMPLPKEAEQYDGPETKRLISLCRELQVTAGDMPFFLSCRKAGSMLGIDHNTASRRFRVLVADGVLDVATRGTTSRATRYHYKGCSGQPIHAPDRMELGL